MSNLPINLTTLTLSLAKKDDLPPILTLFDEAVVWLNQRGIEKQWGTEPFSTSSHIREQFNEWIDLEIFYVARLSNHIVGSLVLNPAAPTYIANHWEHFPSSAFYLEALVTSRTLIGQNLGRMLLQWAEHYTSESGRTTIWLDCWNENPSLVCYYRQMGFVPRGEFLVNEWHGQLFEKHITKNPF